VTVSKAISLEFGTDAPLRIEYALGDGIRCLGFLAPKVSDEESEAEED
jgi:hypothetical protein